MRYVGQNFELPVSLDGADGGKLPLLRRRDVEVAVLRGARAGYGYHNPDDPIEIVNLRLTASAAVARLGSEERKGRRRSARPPIEHRPVWFSTRAAGAHADL